MSSTNQILSDRFKVGLVVYTLSRNGSMPTALDSCPGIVGFDPKQYRCRPCTLSRSHEARRYFAANLFAVFLPSIPRLVYY